MKKLLIVLLIAISSIICQDIDIDKEIAKLEERKAKIEQVRENARLEIIAINYTIREYKIMQADTTKTEE